MKLAYKLALFGYPLAELMLMLQVAAWLGALSILALLLLGIVIGLSLLRGQRLSLLARLRRGSLTTGLLLPELLDGALRAAAALLLILPGFISDGVGLVLLIPAARRALARRLGSERRAGTAVVIDGEFRRLDEPVIPSSGRETGCC